MNDIIISIPYVKPIIVIESNITWVREYCFERFFPFCSFYSNTSAEQVFRLRISKKLGEYKLEYDGNSYDLSEKKLLFYLSGFIHQILSPKKGFVLLHGGALQYKNKAFLLLGKSMSGKTTLTAYLANDGFIYYSDDLILINYYTQSIFPCANYMHIREKGLDVLQNIYLLNLKTKTSSVVNDYKRYLYYPRNIAKTPHFLNNVFFINYKEHMDLVCEKTEQDIAKEKIIENAFSTKSLISTITAAHQLSKNLVSYTITYNNIEDAKKTIINLL